MSISELPHSVLYEPQTFGRGTIALQYNGNRIEEPNGISLKGKEINQRTIHIKDRGGIVSSLRYIRSKDFDTLGVYSCKTNGYLVKNGTYIQLGELGNESLIQKRYDLESGNLISFESQLPSGAKLCSPLSIEEIQQIGATFDMLKDPHTPNPELLARTVQFIYSTLSPDLHL